jgi:outer membrane protein assembly factor BamD (BamD/ComL family)
VAAASPPTVRSAASLYREAEAALGKHDLAAADRSLAQLVAEFSGSALLDQALYERARIAYLRHAWRDAQRQLDKLSMITTSALAEPGAYLACRIAIAASDGDAERCLIAYRAAYPASPHDRDVLDWLAELAFRSGGCAQAGSRIAELARSYPDTTAAWRARCPEAR